MDSEGQKGRGTNESAAADRLAAEADARDEKQKRIDRSARRAMALLIRPYGNAVQIGRTREGARDARQDRAKLGDDE